MERGGTVTVGISDHAQDALGDVVYVELPEPGTQTSLGSEVAVVESVKAASDIYTPCAGTVVGINEALEDAPELVNDSPYGDGWFFKLEVEDEDCLSGLLTAAEYRSICEAEDH